MRSNKSGDRLAMALETETECQFVGRQSQHAHVPEPGE